MINKYFKNLDLACSIGSVALFITWSITGGTTLNPTILRVISGSGVLLKTFQKLKIIKKVEMSNFAYTSYEKY